jgi:ABC-type sugar transport system substrate-binding protein
MQDFLQGHPNFEGGLYFQWPPVAIGAVQALRAAGKKAGDMVVVTTDMEVETERMIKGAVDSGNCG